MKLSREFMVRLRMSDIPQYRLALQVGLNPVTLSKLTNGIVPLEKEDDHLIAIGRLLGLKKSEVIVE